MTNESAEALQSAFLAALVANDAEAVANCYAKNSVNFPVGAMVGHGPHAVAKSWTGFFSTYTVVAATHDEGHLETHGDTAIAWGLFKIVAMPLDGGEVVELLGRYMDVARNIDGNWLYVADHASVPRQAAEYYCVELSSRVLRPWAHRNQMSTIETVGN